MYFLLTIALLWIVSCTADTHIEGDNIGRYSFGDQCISVRNVALGGRATQSSVYFEKDFGYLALAANAIDGNQDSVYSRGSCCHTHVELSPWWRVDLLRSHKIHHITISNRGDCCGERLDGAEILIGNSLANNGNDNPRCARITSIPTGASETFQCHDMVGQYVNVIIRGRQEYLHFCELQVFGIPTSEAVRNVALGGRATQSSVYYTDSRNLAVAANAIDGNQNSTYIHGSCCHTKGQYSPWWRVDLLRSHKIHHITITNRGDCCGERLNGAEILIGNSLENEGNDNPRCARITSIPTGASETFQCHDMVGQYVIVIIRRRYEHLHFCELQVFGIPTSEAVRNIALGGRATQSSVYFEKSAGCLGLAANAIDGNQDSTYTQGSCCHTHNDFSPWWRVDLLRPHKIHHITITNRGDCCGERLNGAEILIGSSLENNGNDNPRCAQITSLPTRTYETFQCHDMVGRYVIVIIRGRQEYLHFCEIQIFGIPTSDDQCETG
ncbi:uncharacterized protein LOC142143299 [Mixophyes fleayi]|uniref:uncharacterized protein LOC142143299 n=1 Tax=Mixophyes fleayi TaxID=3061075 RepID=UPI003F4DE5F8